MGRPLSPPSPCQRQGTTTSPAPLTALRVRDQHQSCPCLVLLEGLPGDKQVAGRYFHAEIPLGRHRLVRYSTGPTHCLLHMHFACLGSPPDAGGVGRAVGGGGSRCLWFIDTVCYRWTADNSEERSPKAAASQCPKTVGEEKCSLVVQSGMLLALLTIAAAGPGSLHGQ